MLSDKLVEFIKKDPTNGVIHFNIYALTNYDKMTPEAQKKADELQEMMIKYVDEAVSKLPESPLKRKTKRLSKGAKGKRLHADTHINFLESPVSSPPKLYVKVRKLFIEHLQTIMDFYQDILDGGTLSGVATFSKLSLLAACMDELLVAFHLSQRAMGGQAFSHLRTIYEAVDLIDLFNREPEAADLWTSGKPWQKVWDELSPGKVRQKLGKGAIFKDIYSLVSGMGAHPSFDMMRSRCRKAIELSEKGNPMILIKIGGSRSSKETVFSHFLLLLSIIMIMGMMIASFERRLNAEEAESAMTKCCMDYADLFDEYLNKPAKEAGMKIDGTAREVMEKLIKALFKEK
ncbi:MAG: hypothetical protein HQ575_03795 [Candidatus Omnitrophica bacterium]|nr:hypothetical protein [Candidatus Omnitrophota bacterium]